MSIHDCLLAVPHGSLPIEMKTLQAAPEGLPSCDSTAFIQEERVLAGGRDDAAETACNVRSCLNLRGESGVTCQVLRRPSVWPPKLGDCIILKPNSEQD